jgi:hypothetical protein
VVGAGEKEFLVEGEDGGDEGGYAVVLVFSRG